MNRSLLIVAAAGLYGLALILVGTWPDPVDQNLNVRGSAAVQWMVDHLGISVQLGYDIVEFSANIALFVPLGVLAMMLIRRLRWGWVVLLGASTSATFELVQVIARPARNADVRDVIANALGAAAGALLVVMLRRRHPG